MQKCVCVSKEKSPSVDLSTLGDSFVDNYELFDKVAGKIQRHYWSATLEQIGMAIDC